MLAEGHVPMSSFDDQGEVTLQGLHQEMTKVNHISGPFTPLVCEQLFNNTPVQVKPTTSSNTSSTHSPKKVSSSHSSREPTYAHRSSSPAVDLMHVTPPQLKTPSLTQHNPNHPSQQVRRPQPPSMQSHPI
jgi:hypothetical protein